MNRLFLSVGILCFLIPFLLQVADKKEQNLIIDTYKSEVENCEDDELLECFQNAIDYNAALFELKQSSVGKEVTLNYENQLNVTKTGMMGHIEIPKINVSLPVFHGTSEEILSTGVGHLEGSSLPVGGENTHAVLTGHCGLPSAELFTRLDELQNEDYFILHICNRDLMYKVISVQIVKPDQVEVIEIEKSKDLVSLITCTPYGINTHRLVVTGERVDRVEEIETENNEMISDGGVDEKIYFIMGIGTMLFLLLFCGGIHRKFGDSCRRKRRI